MTDTLLRRNVRLPPMSSHWAKDPLAKIGIGQTTSTAWPLIGVPHGSGRWQAYPVIGDSHAASTSTGQECSQMAFGQQSGPPASAKQIRELSDLLSREPDIPTSATHVAQWALPSVRPQESSHVTKRRRSSPSYWTQSLMGALPLLRQRGGNPPRSKCWVLCLQNSSRVSFVVADGLSSSPRAGVVGQGWSDSRRVLRGTRNLRR